MLMRIISKYCFAKHYFFATHKNKERASYPLHNIDTSLI